MKQCEGFEINDKGVIECGGESIIYRKNRMVRDLHIKEGLRNRKIYLNHKTTWRLMKKLVCHVRMKKYRFYMGKVGKNTPNLLNRNFHVEKSN